MVAIRHGLKMDLNKAARLLPIAKPIRRHHCMSKAATKQLICLIRDNMVISKQCAGKAKCGSKTARMGETTTIRKNWKDNGNARWRRDMICRG